MSVYKVPQDVEAEDKLLGPFSFRQFIFLIIAVAAAGIAYGLGSVLLPLALIPLPVILFFGALALPLKKDQPMEVYLAAVISFLLKPKNRLWQPDGKEFLVEVTAPVVEEKTYGNNYDQEEVQRRLSYLANLVDSRGWSIRGVNSPDSPMQADFYNEAKTAADVLDDDSEVARNFANLIDKAAADRRQTVLQQMSQIQQTAAAPTQTPSADQSFMPANDDFSNIQLNPYPAMRQSTLSPLGSRPSPSRQTASAPQNYRAEPTNQTGTTDVSPAIMDLANNHHDLSVETIQREANRINEANRAKEKEEGEVVISLR